MANLDYLQELDFPEITCHLIERPELCSAILSHKFHFRVLTMNIRSIHHNFDEFLLTLARLKLKFDVLILTECWINKDSIIPLIDGYTAFRTHKHINRAGGVVAYVSNIWEPEVNEPSFDDANCLHIVLKNKLNLFAIYRSPSFSDITSFLNSLETNINSIQSSSCTIVAGDININTLAGGGDIHLDSSNRYLCLLAELNLVPTINKPTRNKSCLDHIHVSSQHRSVGVVCQSDITDHYLAITGMSTEKQKIENKKRLATRVDYESVDRELSLVDWDVVLGKNLVDEAVSAFMEIISTIVTRNTSQSYVSRSKFTIKPWMTPGLIRCSKHRDNLHTKVRANPNDKVLLKIYSRYKNFHNDLLRKLKRQYESQVLEQNKDNPRKLWDSIRTFSHTKKLKKEPVELTKTKENTLDSLNYCNNFFTNVGKSLADTILTSSNESQGSLAARVKLQVSPPDSLFMRPTDVDEIGSIIDAMRTNSAPGEDGITNKFIKANKRNLLMPLTHICNLSLTEGKFPSEWKSATVIPIFKSGSKSDPCNYRPISLLSCFSKILEKMVNKRLTDFLEEKNLLSDRQFGFRRGKSCQDAVSLLTNVISEHLDNKKACIGVFLDLAKAFDTVSIPILVRKLELFGIRGVALDWFVSYLTGRSQSTRVIDQSSDPRSIEFGVPQGSVLGPTLFIVYINDIIHSNLDQADIICYADDTAIIFSGPSWKYVYDRVESGMSRVAAWLGNNLLTLNLTKTQFLCFYKTGASAPTHSPDIPVHSCGLEGRGPCKCQSITRAYSVKYLGVFIDERLTFGVHLIVTAKRLRKLIYLFKNLRLSAGLGLLRMIYVTLCESVISYCVTVWGGAGKVNMMILERAQRSVLKVMLNKPIRYPTASVYKESEVLSVRGLFLLRVMVHVHKGVISSPHYGCSLEKRRYGLPLPTINSTFARKFPKFLHPYIYNKINSLCCIKSCSISELRHKVRRYLETLSYSEMENILSMVC